ncbi:MAG: hypothetical protein JJU19_12140, partial [Pararhodobacter sp.]|nr:hypothetical protein [Pararhodobacter sp.]
MSRLVFFTAVDGDQGRTIWVSDATPQGTRPLFTRADDAPHSPPPRMAPQEFAALDDGRVVFNGLGALWASDGTEEGTFALTDMGTDLPRTNPAGFTPVGDGRLVFHAFDAGDEQGERPEAGRELWITDGTAAGTGLLKDINPGPAGSAPGQFNGLRNGKVVFTADDGEHGRELWVTDGTEAGTRLLVDFTPGPDGTPFDDFWLYAFSTLPDGRVTFEAPRYFDDDLGDWVRPQWVTDGTPEGTKPLSPPAMPEIPEPFARGPGEPPYPLGNISSSRAFALNDTTTVFFGWGAQELDLDALQGLQVEYQSGLFPGTTGLQIIASEAANVSVLFRGADTEVVRQARIREPGVPEYVEIASNDLRDAGPLTISVSPVVTVPFVPDAAWISVTYEGPNGRVTESPLGSGGGARSAGRDTLSELGIGPISVVAASAVTRDGDSFSIPFTPIEVTGIVPLGTTLWASDGTQEGTHLLAELTPYAHSMGLPQFTQLPGGGVLFIVADRDGYRLWVTDGTEAGSLMLAEGVTSIRALTDADATPFQGRLLFQAMAGDQGGVWVSDGTVQGTGLLIPVALTTEQQAMLGSAMAGTVQATSVQQFTLPDGRMLIEARTGDDDHAIWITDATAGGTRLLTDAFRLFQASDIVQFDADTAMLTLPDTGPGSGRTLFAMNLTDGTLTALAETGQSTPLQPANLTLATPAELLAPESTLFDTRVTLLDGQADSFTLNAHFTDPQGGRLSYWVNDLPEGVSWQPGSGKLRVDADAPAGRQEVTVIAESARGGRTEASFDWELVDTGKLVIQTTGAWGRADRDSPITLEQGSTLTIGLKDGLDQLLRIEDAQATITDGVLHVKGALWSEQVATDLPLMQGSFGIDMNTLAVTDFQDQGETETHRLVGSLVALSLSGLTLLPEAVVLRTDLAFEDELGVLGTTGGLLALRLDDSGISIPAFSEMGVGRWFSKAPLALPLPDGTPFAIEFSDLGLHYDFMSDNAYFSGKGTLAWRNDLADKFGLLVESATSKLILDLAGDRAADTLFARSEKYLRIGTDAEGWNWDIVGEIRYEGPEGRGPGPGWPLVESMRLSLDTPEKSFGGQFKASLPILFPALTLEGALGATWDPVALDSYSFGIDGLNTPLGATGFFIQGGTLAVENIAAQEPDDAPQYALKADMTWGAMPLAPIRGHLGGAVQENRASLDFEIGSRIGYLVSGTAETLSRSVINTLGVSADDVLSFSLFNLSGALDIELDRSRFAFEAEGSLAGDMITGQVAVSAAKNIDQSLPNDPDKDFWDLQASISGRITFPDVLPLIGGFSQSGDALLVYSTDGDSTNDFAAVWTSFSLPALFGRTDATISAGVRIGFDGRVEVLGHRAIKAIGSWELGPELDVVILSAQWENASDSARLELIAPDGTVLSEGDFGTGTGLAAGIALVDDLNGPLGRHVALQNPVAGVWDVRLV